MYGFKLTQEMQDQEFSGGSINCTPLGHAFHVGEALDEGNGAIYTEDSTLASVLRSYPALEAIPEDEIPEDAQPINVPGMDAIAASGSASVVGPWQPQSGIGSVTQGDPGEGEVAAVHADEPGDEQEALDQGVAVSGSGEETTGRAVWGSTSSPADNNPDENE